MFKTTLFTAIENSDLFSINDCTIENIVWNENQTILRVPHMGPDEYYPDCPLFFRDQEITIDENGTAVAMAFLTEKLSDTEQVTFAFYKKRMLVETDVGG